ncbi:lamin tail domain-containing protein [Krasilnikovia sp. M28-CT-15]|uniref:lamin tail domain-containing protein n=1 Tax=Krasilnikovia sp. M28-CT-15 TaxID=3373540 RepID=UPI0038760675
MRSRDTSVRTDRRARRTTLAAFAAATCLAAVTFSSPAHAATEPTISAPASTVGFSEITITGTATPGATVTLYESAYVFNDFYVAINFDTGAPLTATASSSGAFTMHRNVDSGFLFKVKEGDHTDFSNTVKVSVQVIPTLTLASTTDGTVSVDVAANPNQDGLHVQIQRQSGGTWTNVAAGVTDLVGEYHTVLSNQGAGTSKTYRAHIDEDLSTAILPNFSPAQTIKVFGTSTTPDPDPTPTPTPTTPTTPTPPAPKPPAPKPPVPAGPKAGDVQFTLIQYHGKAGLNNEWFRLTNKTSKTINLKGWTVRDASGNTYTFTGSYSLGAGKNVYVRTGKGTNGKPSVRDRYWGKRVYVWNNGGDTATLRFGTRTIDSCKWTRDRKVTTC